MKKVYEIELSSAEHATFHIEAESLEEAQAEAERCLADCVVEPHEMEWEPSGSVTVADVTEVRGESAMLLRSAGEIANA